MPTVSVIIPAYKHRDFVLATLADCRRHSECRSRTFAVSFCRAPQLEADRKADHGDVPPAHRQRLEDGFGSAAG